MNHNVMKRSKDNKNNKISVNSLKGHQASEYHWQTILLTVILPDLEAPLLRHFS